MTSLPVVARRGAPLAFSVLVGLAACAPEEPPTGNTGGSTSSSGGTGPVGGSPGAGGKATGGASSGGRASGGTATGGIATGGAPSGGIGGAATFRNGVFWNDTSGNRVEAHGGGFLKVGDTWFWFGEDKSQNSGNFYAVNCYSSRDLNSWQFRRAIITRNTAPDLNTADRIIERPKVIYNDTTKKYVMWLHWEGQNYAEAKAGVFTCDTVDGNYTYVSAFRPNNNMSRDDTLFKDDDGKAYFISAANDNKDLAVYQLSDDYLTVKQQVATLWPGSSREAPALFKQGSTYFLITSGCTGWDPNQAAYGTASSVSGPWSALKNLGDSTTYDSQSTYVVPFVGTAATTYIYAGDRWQDPDLKSSKYIWLPLVVNGTSLTLNYYAEWTLDLGTGRWQ